MLKVLAATRAAGRMQMASMLVMDPHRPSSRVLICLRPAERRADRQLWAVVEVMAVGRQAPRVLLGQRRKDQRSAACRDMA